MDTFIKKYRVKDSSYNYVLLSSPFGKYNIPSDKTDLLNECILDCKKSGIDFGLCQVHNDDIPELFYLDIDLLLKEESNVSDTILKKLLTICNNVFKKHLTEYDSTAIVFKKPEIERDYTNYHYKNGIHIYFPYICLYSNERYHIYLDIISEAEKSHLFENLNLVNKSIDNIIDRRVIKTNAILKVFCNKPSKNRYIYYKTFNNEITDIKKNYTDEELIKLLDIWKDTHTNFITQLPEEKIAPTIDPLFNKSIFSKVPSSDEIEVLLDMLSPSRCENYNSWINVGLCLHNIDENLFDVWKNWSKKIPSKASKTRFLDIWKNFKKKDTGLKYGSLISWAKEDSPEEFNQFRNDQITDSIKNSLNFSFKSMPYPVDIAHILKEKFSDMFICSSISNKRWYEFRNTIWVEVQNGYTLFNQISEYLINEYLRQDIELNKEIIEIKTKTMSMPDSNEKDLLNKQLEDISLKQVKINKLIRCLKTTSFKRNIMEEAMPLFFDEKFEENLNEKKNVIVFNNGVYDLNKGILREGRPNDFMTFTTGINYVEFDENDPNVQTVLHIFSQIHPNEEIRNFFFSTLAASLHGHKVEQKCNIWTGNGSNGKSLTAELCSKALGDYFHSPNITLFTRKAGASGNASPEKVVLKGRRIGILQEPENDDKLNTSIMKQITGNDTIEARALYHETIKFKPQISVFISCNDLPKVPTTDGGTWRRIRVVPFTSKFVNNPSKPNEYKVDPHLAEQLDSLAEAFMSILIHYYNCLKSNNFIIKEPKEVTLYTNDYKNDNDVLQNFIADTIDETNNDKDKIKITELFTIFKEWVKENNINGNVVNNKDFKRQLISKLGIQHNITILKGYKLKNDINQFSVLF